MELAPRLDFETTSGHRVLFVNREVIGDALNAKKSKSIKIPYSKMLSVIREDLKTQSPFEGTFNEKCEENKIP